MFCRIHPFQLLTLALVTFLPPIAGWSQEATSPKSNPRRIQIAILLDTSGSMEGLINQARTQLWKMVNEFGKAKFGTEQPRLEVALFEYGNDGLPAAEGYTRLIVPFTDDLDKVSQELFALRTNGGSEFCGWVIDQAARTLEWSDAHDDLQCIFIAGNEPFSQGPKEYQAACRRDRTGDHRFHDSLR